MNSCILLLFALFSTASLAVDRVSNLPIGPADCRLLSEAVSIKLSRGVSGAWTCDEPTQNIKVATCSRLGSRRSFVVQCTPIDTQPDGTDRLNSAECAVPGGGVELTGVKGFVASSSFPASVMVELGADCDDAKIVAIDFLAD